MEKRIKELVIKNPTLEESILILSLLGRSSNHFDELYSDNIGDKPGKSEIKRKIKEKADKISEKKK